MSIIFEEDSVIITMQTKYTNDWILLYYIRLRFNKAMWGCPRGVMVKALDYGIVVREFVLQSHYYVLLYICVYIYIYIFLLNTLSGGKSCSVAPGVAVPPWATETVLSPWLAADEARVSHVLSHVVWWKYEKFKIRLRFNKAMWGCPRRVMVKALDYGIVVREFVLQSHYYVHFRYEPPYPPSYGLNSTTAVLLEEWLWH